MEPIRRDAPAVLHSRRVGRMTGGRLAAGTNGAMNGFASHRRYTLRITPRAPAGQGGGRHRRRPSGPASRWRGGGA